MTGPAFELVPIPDHVEAATNPACEVCLGCGWVCENHPLRPFDSGTAADCICGAGQPCVCTGIK